MRGRLLPQTTSVARYTWYTDPLTNEVSVPGGLPGGTNPSVTIREDEAATVNATIAVPFDLSGELRHALAAAQAGYRGQAPLIAFLFFRFVMPFIIFVIALIYLFGISHMHYPATTKFFGAVGIGILGYYLPDVFISNLISRRQESIMQAFPAVITINESAPNTFSSAGALSDGVPVVPQVDLASGSVALPAGAGVTAGVGAPYGC